MLDTHTHTHTHTHTVWACAHSYALSDLQKHNIEIHTCLCTPYTHTHKHALIGTQTPELSAPCLWSSHSPRSWPCGTWDMWPITRSKLTSAQWGHSGKDGGKGYGEQGRACQRGPGPQLGRSLAHHPQWFGLLDAKERWGGGSFEPLSSFCELAL